MKVYNKLCLLDGCFYLKWLLAHCAGANDLEHSQEFYVATQWLILKFVAQNVYIASDILHKSKTSIKHYSTVCVCVHLVIIINIIISVVVVFRNTNNYIIIIILL